MELEFIELTKIKERFLLVKAAKILFKYDKMETKA